MQIIRFLSTNGATLVGVTQNDQLIGIFQPGTTLSELLHLSLSELRERIEHITQSSEEIIAHLLPPIDGESEVWAAGVTYKRSEVARREESDTPDIYSRVYTAERPEIFFKANARRVSGAEAAIAIRADSTWNVPEPELVVVTNTAGEIVGYTIGNDVSSRSIEGDNPLYLPQAKVYAGSCALGPGITPVWEIADPYVLTINMTIERNGQTYWSGQTNTAELKRKLGELVNYLYREDEFPDGAFLCTGTALVPDAPFTLEANDIVHIDIDQLTSLHNHVVQGKTALLSSRR
ncbi:MAG TPA: fumarylacetoacetate hydrolase family protein [Dictyobacter sp.]|jgi:2-dehydro-3-deoxy-D-arabinonate dehydratase|nr:fumarylacetoacetate hydrolase family protein [Dictyobacter sp.]